MKNIFTFFFLIAFQHISAQITLTKNDLPAPGDTIFMSTIGSLTGISASATGTSYTWDFTALNVLQERKDSFVAVNSTPFAYQFFFNNPFTYPENRSTVAIPSTPPNLPAQSPIQLSNVYNFYKATSTEYAQTGFGAGINGLPASVRFDPALDMDILYKFPLTYGNQADSCHSFFELNVPNTAYFSEDRKRKNVVDGWGTLQLPNRTYPVLRVKSTSVITDSIYIAQFGLGFRLPSRTEIEYKWLSSGKKEPLLVLVEGTNNTIIRGEFQYEPFNTSLNENELINNAVTIYPNPANNLINIKTLAKDKVNKIVILNETGTIIIEVHRSEEISISDLNDGFYILEIHTTNGEVKKAKFVKN